MAVFKCKMCGGDLEVQKGESIGTCSYCGSTMTLPKLDDEKRANLYDRANHYRRNNEFDKAMALYENILNEDKTDAEAYWSLVLCKYGIEYVEDPKSHKRVPTCNRTQYTSILADEDYKKALEYADSSAKRLYEEEARVIDGIQKGILEISSKEDPFDIFICYKETDNNGRRTPDSVLAQEIYFQLNNEGYKVFFSRITLESVLGTVYEPYIFAALNSAKVMIVVGTKPEYFNSPWVKNEWSRFLGLIKSGSKKTLIPAYKDMDPYDLPEEFSHLQSQDMSKLGFISDLSRGIKKILDTKAPKETKVDIIQVQSEKNVEALLKRAFLMLEDSNFSKADELLEQVLNLNPELPQAYLGKLMVEFNVKNQSELKNIMKHIGQSMNFQKFLRFSSSKDKEEMINLSNEIENNIKVSEDNEKYTEIYNLIRYTTHQYDFERALVMIDNYENKNQRFLDLKAVILEKKVKFTYDKIYDIYDHAVKSDELDVALKIIDNSDNSTLDSLRDQVLRKKNSLIKNEIEKILTDNPIEFETTESLEKNIDLYFKKLVLKYPKYKIDQEVLSSLSLLEIYREQFQKYIKEIEEKKIKEKKRKIILRNSIIGFLAVISIVLILVSTVFRTPIENYFDQQTALKLEAESQKRELWNGSYYSEWSEDHPEFRISYDENIVYEWIYNNNYEESHPFKWSGNGITFNYGNSIQEKDPSNVGQIRYENGEYRFYFSDGSGHSLIKK